MPTSSGAYALEKKKVLKCKKKSLTPTGYPSHSTIVRATTSTNPIRRSQSTQSLAPKLTNNEPLILKTYPDGSVHLSRTSEAKETSPDRICLDRRALALIPILDNEANLRLLSLQHNLITSLESVMQQSFPILVFLDVYDNQIKAINFLDHLLNLRVLLMGKNRLTKIEGLSKLTKLEVLDLHGNQITSVGGLSQCQSLKVLNLAGNQIKMIGANDLQGLATLQELNLRRNHLKKLLGFNETPNLQKLFLSNNDIHSIDDIYSIAETPNVVELTIDNNPVFQNGESVSFLISCLPKLSRLNTMIVSEQVRKSAMAWRRNKEHSSDLFKDLSQNINFNGRREEVISNARTNWELLRTQTKYISTASNNIEKSSTIKPDTDIITTKLVKRETRTKIVGNQHNIVDKRKYNVTRTNSMETDSSSNQSDQFRLPPILVPIISKLEVGSTSSIGPNFDSSISSIISSNTSQTDDDDESNVDEPQNETDAGENKTAGFNNDEIPTLQEVSAPPLTIASGQVETSSNLSSNTSSSNNASDASSSKRPGKGRRCVKSAMNSSSKILPKANRATTAKPQNAKKIASGLTEIPPVVLTVPREREQGGDYLIEICGRHLNIFGHGALRFVDKAWCQSKANDVHTVNFHYANFNAICPVLSKVKAKFPHAEHFVFKETNIYCLGQMNALAEIQGLASLTILPDGNPIVEKDWREYAIYRLTHWGLKVINDESVAESDIVNANETYASLCDLVLWSLPNETLQPLLSRMHINVNDDLDCKKWLMNADPALRSVISKEALQWRKLGTSMQDDIAMRQKARCYIGNLMHELCNTIRKVQLFNERWPDILQEIVRNTLIDYSQLDIYTKRKLLDLMKS